VTSLNDLPIRSDLVGKKPYGAPMLDVPVTLNVNENTHPVPAEVQQAILDSIAGSLAAINRYPDREFTGLRQDLATYLTETVAGRVTIAPDQIWAANGSNEVLQHVFQAFGGPGRTALGFSPTYSMHPIIAESTGTQWIGEAREENFGVSAAHAVKAVRDHRPNMVFFCTPNNPTGNAVSLETIAAAYEETDGVVVVDEAYQEFHPQPEHSALTLLPDRPRLLVSRTMSKAFAFAGARVGYLAADPAVIDALRLVRLPYHLSAITQAAARAALAHRATMLAMVEDIRGQRDRLLATLPTLGYPVTESVANFVLFSGVTNPTKTFEDLLAAGVLVRDVGIVNSLRVTAGTAEETTTFLEELAKLSQ
jgi:histidinol-phosphate aminotransferase